MDRRRVPKLGQAGQISHSLACGNLYEVYGNLYGFRWNTITSILFSGIICTCKADYLKEDN